MNSAASQARITRLGMRADTGPVGRRLNRDDHGKTDSLTGLPGLIAPYLLDYHSAPLLGIEYQCASVARAELHFDSRHRQSGSPRTACSLRGARFDPGPCPFRRDASASYRADCGTVAVPENRVVPEGRKVRLNIAALRASNLHSQPDPVVFLGGSGFRTPSLLGYGLDERGQRALRRFVLTSLASAAAVGCLVTSFPLVSG